MAVAEVFSSPQLGIVVPRKILTPTTSETISGSGSLLHHPKHIYTAEPVVDNLDLLNPSRGGAGALLKAAEAGDYQRRFPL